VGRLGLPCDCRLCWQGARGPVGVAARLPAVRCPCRAGRALHSPELHNLYAHAQGARGAQGKAMMCWRRLGRTAARKASAYIQALTYPAMRQEVLAAMGARLAELRAWWRSGRLAAAGLNAGAVAGLVRALFEDTEPRRDVLAELAGGR